MTEYGLQRRRRINYFHNAPSRSESTRYGKMNEFVDEECEEEVDVAKLLRKMKKKMKLTRVTSNSSADNLSVDVVVTITRHT